MMRLRILFVSNTFWSMYNFRKELIKRLVDEGNSVFIAASDDEYVEKLEELGACCLRLILEPRSTKITKELLAFLDIYKKIKRVSPDVVINYTIKPVLYSGVTCRLAGIRSMNFITGIGGFFLSNKLITAFFWPFYRLALGGNSKTYYLNEEDYNTFKSLKLISDNEARILPGEGVSLNDFTRSIDHRPITTAKLQLLYASRLLWDKGLGDLVEAIKLLRIRGAFVDVRVVGLSIKGDPRFIQEETLKKWEDEGLITYLGYSKNVASLIESCDCLVYPTYYGEGVPRILMEACALGTICIASNISGCREAVIDNHNGYTHAPRDVHGIMGCIIKLINTDPEKLGEFRRNSLDLAIRKFDIEKIVNIYLSELRANG